MQRGLRDLGRYDRSGMTDAQRLSADVLQHHLQSYVEAVKYDDYMFPLDQFGGANIWLPNALSVQHPIRTAKDISNYLARLRLVAPRMAEAVVESRRRADKDLIPPRFILRLTIDQMRRFVDTPPAQSPFVTSLDERAAAIKELAPADRAAFTAEAERLVRESVYPEWNKAVAFLEMLVPRSADRAGLWRLEGGAEAYVHFLKSFTTTNLTPDQIHESACGRWTSSSAIWMRSCASSADRAARSRSEWRK